MYNILLLCLAEWHICPTYLIIYTALRIVCVMNYTMTKESLIWHSTRNILKGRKLVEMNRPTLNMFLAILTYIKSIFQFLAATKLENMEIGWLPVLDCVPSVANFKVRVALRDAHWLLDIHQVAPTLGVVKITGTVEPPMHFSNDVFFLIFRLEIHT